MFFKDFRHQRIKASQITFSTLNYRFNTYCCWSFTCVTKTSSIILRILLDLQQYGVEACMEIAVAISVTTLTFVIAFIDVQQCISLSYVSTSYLLEI